MKQELFRKLFIHKQILSGRQELFFVCMILGIFFLLFLAEKEKLKDFTNRKRIAQLKVFGCFVCKIKNQFHVNFDAELEWNFFLLFFLSFGTQILASSHIRFNAFVFNAPTVFVPLREFYVRIVRLLSFFLSSLVFDWVHAVSRGKRSARLFP